MKKLNLMKATFTLAAAALLQFAPAASPEPENARTASPEVFAFIDGPESALLFAEKAIRKVRGYRFPHQLSASLKSQTFDSYKIAA